MNFGKTFEECGTEKNDSMTRNSRRDDRKAPSVLHFIPSSAQLTILHPTCSESRFVRSKSILQLNDMDGYLGKLHHCI